MDQCDNLRAVLFHYAAMPSLIEARDAMHMTILRAAVETAHENERALTIQGEGWPAWMWGLFAGGLAVVGVALGFIVGVAYGV